MSCALVERLSLDFGKTYYYTTGLQTQQDHKNFAFGLGLGNIIKFDERGNPLKFWSHVDEADLIFLPHVGYGDVADFIRSHFPKKRVFSCGGADILEEDRYFLKQVQKKIGLPVQPYIRAVGMDDLREKLKIIEDVVVKPHGFRGDRETFPVHNYDEVEEILNIMDYDYGVGREYQQFVVEKMLDIIAEIGCDLFFNGTKYLTPYLWGIEREAPYIGKYDDKLPYFLEKTMKAFAPVFSSYGYKGAVSTEEIVINKKLSYLLDMTVRFPQPLASIQTLSLDNFSEVIYGTAGGEDVSLKNKGKYVGCLPVQSDVAQKHWLRLIYDKKFEKNIKMVFGCKSGKKTFAVPGYSTVANIVTFGSSMKEVAYQLEELIGEIDGDGVEKDTTALGKIMKDLEALSEFGIKF